MKNKKLFPGFHYWLSLPGVLAFSGLCCGISISKHLLTDEMLESLASFYTISLFLTTFLCFCTGILCRKPILRFLFFTIAGSALFTGSELNYSSFCREIRAASFPDREIVLFGEISSPIAQKKTYNQFSFKIMMAHDPEADMLLKGKVLTCTSKKPVPPCGKFRIKGLFKLPNSPVGPFGFNEREYLRTRNIWGKLIVLQIYPAINSKKFSSALLGHKLRSSVHSTINKIDNRDVKSIFHAAFLGEREHLSGSLKDSFRKAGIFHLLAISGFHAGLLFTAFFACFKLLKLPSNTCMLLALAVLWAYLFFIGFIPSLFRATVMASFICMSLLIGKKNHILHSLSLAGAFWLLMFPHSLFEPGFQLSFAATAGIILLHPVLDELTPRPQNETAAFLLQALFSSIWVSTAGFLFTAPVLLYHFGTVSLFGILFNTVAILLMTVAMWLFFIALACDLLLPFIADILINIAELSLSALIYSSHLSESVPFSELALKAPTAIHIITAALFTLGLCAVAKERRIFYISHTGGAMILVFILLHLQMSKPQSVELLQLYQKKTVLNAILLPDRSVWVVGGGTQKEVNRICDQGIKPWLHHKRSKDEILLIINTDTGNAGYSSPALHHSELPTPKSTLNSSCRQHFTPPFILATPDDCSLSVLNRAKDCFSLFLNVNGITKKLPMKPRKSVSESNETAAYAITKMEAKKTKQD
ncbi:MAG: ComEC/Rec2 family competence protein [Chitinispirillaceae bacterium]